MLAETGFVGDREDQGGTMASRLTAVQAGKKAARVTISDVATALDMTKSTVSRALNGYPDIAKATRIRVERMAEQLNYRPLSSAQAIRTGRTRSLGFVLQLADHDAMRPFLAEFLAGLSAGASADGYTLTVASADCADNVAETFEGLVRDGKADGFVLPRALVDDPRVAQLSAAQVPFVLYGRPQNPADCCWFDVRGEDAMTSAVQRLHALGHQRIAFINGGSIYEYARLRYEGYCAGMAAVGLPVDPELVLSDAVQIEAGEAAAHQLFSLPQPPTAIVCAVDLAALGVYRAAANRGLVVGRDVSVIGYDGIPDGAHVTPQLSTFCVDNRNAGQRLASLLIRCIRGEDPEDLRETATATFVDRGSIGPARPAGLSKVSI